MEKEPVLDGTLDFTGFQDVSRYNMLHDVNLR